MSNLIKIGMCGWGNVATGLYRQLSTNKNLDLNFEITCIGARRDNAKCDPSPIKIHRDIFDVIDDDIDVLIELIGGVEVAKELIERALTRGKHVITANKAVIFEHGEELISLADQNNVKLLFESAVCAGTPIIKMLSNDLQANKISKIAGMLNGTTNYILSKMEEGESYEKTLKNAQELGYAEPDPSLDVNGTDAAHKIGILSSLAFNSSLPAHGFHIEGIEQITQSDFIFAKEFGFVVKHLAVAKKTDHGIELRSHPTLLKSSSNLASLKGVRNGIQIDTDLLGEFHIAGSGAGQESTASGIISDLISLSRTKTSNSMNMPVFINPVKIIPFTDLSFRYYIYLEVKDKPGVLAKVTKIFADQNISFDKVSQKDQISVNKVPIIIISDPINELNMQNALKEASSHEEIIDLKIIRIED